MSAPEPSRGARRLGRGVSPESNISQASPAGRDVPEPNIPYCETHRRPPDHDMQFWVGCAAVLNRWGYMRINCLRRRQFIALLGGAAAWPVGARAQRSAMTVVGFLSGGSSEGLSRPLVAFRQGLGESGYFESKNVTIEYRWANGQYDQLPTLVADLLRRQVTVIAPTTPVAALAAKQATTLIPIVFALGSDPVKDGLVLRLNRPGGNVTVAPFFGNLLAAKRAELLHQLVADAKVFAVLLNPKNANVELEKSDRQQAVHPLGLDLVLVH